MQRKPQGSRRLWCVFISFIYSDENIFFPYFPGLHRQLISGKNVAPEEVLIVHILIFHYIIYNLLENVCYHFCDHLLFLANKEITGTKKKNSTFVFNFRSFFRFQVKRGKNAEYPFFIHLNHNE